MKKVSTKQNERHIRVMNKRLKNDSKRKIRRKLVLEQMRRINLAHRRISKAQRRMVKLAKQR
jgi:hypothetical protein